MGVLRRKVVPLGRRGMGGKPAESVSNGGGSVGKRSFYGKARERVPVFSGGGEAETAGGKKEKPGRPMWTAGFLFSFKVLGDQGTSFRRVCAQGVASGG